MIDQKLKAWILEVNHSPSLNIHFQKDEIPRDKLKTPTEVVTPHICPVDLYVKSKVVSDAINLAWKVSTGEKDLTEFGSLSKIYPNVEDEEAAQISDITSGLSDMFCLLSNFRETISSTDFERLMGKEFFKETLRICKADLALSFQYVSENAKHVDFLKFCQVMQHFHSRKVVAVPGFAAMTFLDFVWVCIDLI